MGSFFYQTNPVLWLWVTRDVNFPTGGVWYLTLCKCCLCPCVCVCICLSVYTFVSWLEPEERSRIKFYQDYLKSMKCRKTFFFHSWPPTPTLNPHIYSVGFYGTMWRSNALPQTARILILASTLSSWMIMIRSLNLCVTQSPHFSNEDNLSRIKWIVSMSFPQ